MFCVTDVDEVFRENTFPLPAFHHTSYPVMDEYPLSGLPLIAFHVSSTTDELCDIPYKPVGAIETV